MRTLRRAPVQLAPVTATTYTDELATKARELWGYRVPSQMPGQATVAATLNELGIQPFTAESVARYKNRRLWQIYWQNAGACVHDAMPWVGVPSFVGLIAAVAWGCASWWFGGSLLWRFLPALITAALLGLALWLDNKTRDIHRVAVTWHTQHLRDYSGIIPSYALQAAVAVAAKLDGLPISANVDRLSLREYPTWALLYVEEDTADSARTRYYLDVCDPTQAQPAYTSTIVQQDDRNLRGVHVREKA